MFWTQQTFGPRWHHCFLFFRVSQLIHLGTFAKIFLIHDILFNISLHKLVPFKVPKMISYVNHWHMRNIYIATRKYVIKGKHVLYHVHKVMCWKQETNICIFDDIMNTPPLTSFIHMLPNTLHSLSLYFMNGWYHRLQTPNEGINPINLKIWANVADKICFGRN